MSMPYTNQNDHRPTRSMMRVGEGGPTHIYRNEMGNKFRMRREVLFLMSTGLYFRVNTTRRKIYMYIAYRAGRYLIRHGLWRYNPASKFAPEDWLKVGKDISP